MQPSNQSLVLLVDDHPLLRQGLRGLINRQPDLLIAAEAESVDGAIREVRRFTFDAAIVDLTLGESSGFDLIRQIRTEGFTFPILVLSMGEERLYAPRALRAGASGYVMKDEPPERVVEGLRAVLRGRTFVSDQTRDRLVRGLMAGDEKASEDRAVPERTLSDREIEVFEMLGRGQTTREIADVLSLSIKTIETYRGHIKKKLGLRNATELVQQATLWVSRERPGV